MRQVEIFSESTPKTLQKTMNAWLLQNKDATLISIGDMTSHVSEPFPGPSTMQVVTYAVLVQYEKK